MPSSGPNSADIIESVDPLGGADPGTYAWSWANPANAMASDNSYATSQVTGFATGTFTGTDELRTRDFDFAIPDEATITGIEVFVECKAATANRAQGPICQLLFGNAGNDDDWIGDTRPTTSGHAAISDTVYTRGGPSDLWNAELAASKVNSANFGVALQFVGPAFSNHTTAVSVDAVTMTVYYSVGTAYSLSCAGGVLTGSGGAMTPRRSGALASAGGAFTLSGGAMTPTGVLPAAGRSFAIAGGAIASGQSARIASAGGTFSTAGGNAALPIRMACGGRTLAIAAGALTPSRAQLLALAEGSFTLSGGSVVPQLRTALAGAAFTPIGGTMIAFWWDPVPPVPASWSAVVAMAASWTEV